VYHRSYVVRNMKWSIEFMIYKVTDFNYHDDLIDFKLMLILNSFY
jgi:hypothetical protein